MTQAEALRLEFEMHKEEVSYSLNGTRLMFAHGRFHQNLQFEPCKLL